VSSAWRSPKIVSGRRSLAAPRGPGQRERIAGYCAEQGWRLIETLADDGVPGGRRERLRRLSERVQATGARAVVVYHRVSLGGVGPVGDRPWAHTQRSLVPSEAHFTGGRLFAAFSFVCQAASSERELGEGRLPFGAAGARIKGSFEKIPERYPGELRNGRPASREIGLCGTVFRRGCIWTSPPPHARSCGNRDSARAGSVLRNFRLRVLVACR
jgi:hypothetical protein